MRVLRDARSGQLAYAQAELSEPGAPARRLTPQTFSSELPLAR
jgi:hypothetical protein